MKIRFIGERPRDLARPARTMQPGEEFEVLDSVGRQLLEQPRWYEPADAAARKALAALKAPPTDDKQDDKKAPTEQKDGEQK